MGGVSRFTPLSAPEPEPLTPYQLGAALRDLSCWGWIYVQEYEHARQVAEAAREAGLGCQIREALVGSGWTVVATNKTGRGHPRPEREGE